MFELGSFPHQWQRDLYWALKSPTLITHSGSTKLEIVKQEDCDTWANEILSDFSYHSVLAIKNPMNRFQGKNFRLGYYFEDLLGYWLSNKADVTGLERNIMVKDGKNLLGELDFMFALGGKSIHMEAAFKFYLNTGISAEPAEWKGTQPHDNLELKINKTIHLTQNTLDTYRIDNQKLHINFQSIFFLKGYLFTYFDNEVMKIPEIINPGALSGKWYRYSEFIAIAKQTGTENKCLTEERYLIPDRKRWISPVIAPFNDPGLMNHTHLVSLLKSKVESRTESSVLVCKLTPAPHGYIESERMMIVPDAWPQTRTAIGS